MPPTYQQWEAPLLINRNDSHLWYIIDNDSHYHYCKHKTSFMKTSKFSLNKLIAFSLFLVVALHFSLAQAGEGAFGW
ncbi:MAG: hypothetical protein RI975_1175, partial [Pseudomonadota bacterium]